jgi:hypothetical protein
MADASGGNIDGVMKQQAAIGLLGELVRAFRTAFPTKWSIGAFTCAAAVTTTVNDINVTATAHITLTALNVAAANMAAGVTAPYVSARTPGVSFAISTANGAAAAGTEQFSYHVVSK